MVWEEKRGVEKARGKSIARILLFSCFGQKVMGLTSTSNVQQWICNKGMTHGQERFLPLQDREPAYWVGKWYVSHKRVKGKAVSGIRTYVLVCI
jgi:hypothetical protein